MLIIVSQQSEAYWRSKKEGGITPTKGRGQEGEKTVRVTDLK
jgi:hypothetical protein